MALAYWAGIGMIWVTAQTSKPTKIQTIKKAIRAEIIGTPFCGATYFSAILRPVVKARPEGCPRVLGPT